METQFKILFSIRVFHTYFENNICRCISFLPTATTEKLIKRYLLTIKVNSNGFDFYTTNKKNVIDFLHYIERVSPEPYFEFNMQTSNPNFNIFTNVPTTWMGLLEYSCNNITTNKTTGKTILSPNYVPQSSSPILGTLKIYFANLIQSLSVGTCEYEINYEARVTQWHYYIMNTSNIILDNPAISSKSEIHFDPVATTVIPTGQEALLFSSGTQRIAMSEVPQYTFDLVNNITTNHAIMRTNIEKTIFKGLPNPDPGKIQILENQGETIIVSPMYVYV